MVMSKIDETLIAIATSNAAPSYAAQLVEHGCPTLTSSEAAAAADELGLRLIGMGRLDDAGRVLRLAMTLRRARALDLV